MREPRAHLFISLEQARLLKEARFSDQHTDNMHKYLKLRGEIQKYLPNISDFKVRIHKFKEELLEIINQKIKNTLDYLDGLERSIIIKADEISGYMASSSIEGSTILEKYELEGLGGVLQEFPQEFIILENEVKGVIDNMIIIGKDVENIKSCTDSDDLEGLHPNIYEPDISSMSKKCEAKQSSRKYQYKLASGELIRVDEYKKVEVKYPLYTSLPSYSYHNLCGVWDNKVLIIGVNGQQYMSSFTFIYDLATFECIQLGNMKTHRPNFGLFYHEKKVYTFGGLLSYPNQVWDSYRNRYIDTTFTQEFNEAEMMEWDGKEWISLPNMQHKVANPFCYAKDNKIYILGPGSCEYLDLSNYIFYTIGEKGIPRSSNYNVVDNEDYIYILSDKTITIFDSLFGYQASLSMEDHRNRNIKIIKYTNGVVFGASTSLNCLRLHDCLDQNYGVLKTIHFKEPRGELYLRPLKT